MNKLSRDILIIMLFFLLANVVAQKRHGIESGTYEFYIDARYEWLRFRMNRDSTVVFENRSLWQLDSSNYTIGYAYGRWKQKGRIIYFSQANGLDEYDAYLDKTRWKYKRRRIYSADKNFKKFCLRKID